MTFICKRNFNIDQWLLNYYYRSMSIKNLPLPLILIYELSYNVSQRIHESIVTKGEPKRISTVYSPI